jgi:alkylation response protein AidB-like acyl-CoA dehydrogenase
MGDAATTESRWPVDRADKRDALMEAVDEVREVLAANADAAEAQRTMTSASVAALEEAGLFGLKLPRELGGAEADPVTHLEVIEALSYVDGSSGWTAMIGSTSIGLLGTFLPDDAIDRIFAGGRPPRAAAVTMPGGKAERVDGGYRLSGRWPFASGVRHAHWVAGAGFVDAGDEGPPIYRMFVAPIEDAELLDTWHVTGLRGTGSCDFTLTDQFVPDNLTFNFFTDPRQRGGVLYNLRAPGSMANEHAGCALGVARRALDTVTAIAATKKRGYAMARSSLAGRSVFQRTLGECDLRLRAARSLLVDVYERAWERACAEQPVEPALMADLRANAAYSTAVATEVTTQAFRYAGAAALQDSNLLQRHLRDLNAASQHITVSDIAYENHGQFLLGLPDADPRG